MTFLVSMMRIEDILELAIKTEAIPNYAPLIFIIIFQFLFATTSNFNFISITIIIFNIIPMIYLHKNRKLIEDKTIKIESFFLEWSWITYITFSLINETEIIDRQHDYLIPDLLIVSLNLLFLFIPQIYKHITKLIYKIVAGSFVIFMILQSSLEFLVSLDMLIRVILMIISYLLVHKLALDINEKPKKMIIVLLIFMNFILLNYFILFFTFSSWVCCVILDIENNLIIKEQILPFIRNEDQRKENEDVVRTDTMINRSDNRTTYKMKGRDLLKKLESKNV